MFTVLVIHPTIIALFTCNLSEYVIYYMMAL